MVPVAFGLEIDGLPAFSWQDADERLKGIFCKVSKALQEAEPKILKDFEPFRAT